MPQLSHVEAQDFIKIRILPRFIRIHVYVSFLKVWASNHYKHVASLQNSKQSWVQSFKHYSSTVKGFSLWPSLSFHKAGSQFSSAPLCNLSDDWPDSQVRKFLEEEWLMDMEDIQLLQQPSQKHILPGILCVDENFYEEVTHIRNRRKYISKSIADYTETTYVITSVYTKRILYTI